MTTACMEEAQVRNLPPIVDVPTAASVLGISRATAYRLVAAGEWPIPVLRLGRYLRVSRADLMAFIGLEP